MTQEVIKIFCFSIIIGIITEKTFVFAAPERRYSESGFGRSISNGLDNHFNGGMNKNPIYEGYVRPIIHTAWHGAAGAAMSLDNGRKTLGSYITEKNPNYHDSQHEYDRAATQYGRIGVGRPEYQKSSKD
uniref:Serum amyloid A protein n=1 Tax=Panagrolaimus davidi TaxID=227884 RepID=A0A914PNP3_9BILA